MKFASVFSGRFLSVSICVLLWFNPGMNIMNLNPDEDIGASSWLVEMDEHRILLDAGMHPKREGQIGRASCRERV